MAYASQTDLEDACGGAARLVQFTDWNNDRVADADRITSALDKAAGEMDSYIVKQRAVPLANPTPKVKEVNAVIALYALARARGMVNEQLRTDYEDALKWLDGVSKGTIMLDVDPQPTAASSRIDAYSSRPSTKDVSRAKLKGFS